MTDRTLRPEQSAAIDAVHDLFQHNTGVILDGKMGSGKTATALMALEGKGSTLIVAPPNVARNVWPAEIAAWLPTAMAVYLSRLPNRVAAERLEAKDYVNLYVITESQLALFNPTLIKELGIDNLIIDELANYRHSGSARVKQLRKLQKARAFKRTLGLTGTSVTEGLRSLYGIGLVMNGGVTFGTSKARFESQYFEQAFYTGQKTAPLPGAESILHRRYNSITVKLADPPHVANTLIHYKVTLCDETRDKIRAMARDMVLGDDVEAPNAAALTAKLAQLASGVVYPNADMTDENDTGEFIEYSAERVMKTVDLTLKLKDSVPDKVPIVVYQHRADEVRIREELMGFDFKVVNPNKSTGWEQQIRANVNKAVLLTHPQSIAHGVNIQDICQSVIWCGVPWSRDRYDQMNARVIRPGQTSKARIYLVMSEDTIDDNVIFPRLEKKAETQQRLNDYLKQFK